MTEFDAEIDDLKTELRGEREISAHLMILNAARDRAGRHAALEAIAIFCLPFAAIAVALVCQ